MIQRNRSGSRLGCVTRRASLVILVLSLAGCSGTREWCKNGFKVGPEYCRPGADVSESWIEASDPHLRANGEPDACWWTAFGDPALNQLVTAASEQNLTLKMACFRILEARAERGVAVGNLFPQQQEMTAQYSRAAMSANAYPFNMFALPKYFYDNWSAGFDAAWELDFWGRFRRAVEAADAHLDARVEGYDDVLVLLQAEVAATYIQMRTFEERLELARKNVELQNETLRIATLRAKQGLVTDLDVEQATTNLGATESLIPVLQTGHRRTQNRLCVLTARPPHQLTQALALSGSIPIPPQEVVVGIPAELLRRRPDVRQAERQAAAQSARIGIAESEFYPHIAITGTIGLQAENASQFFESGSLVGAIGPGIRWNILNYGRIRNNVRAQDARFQQSVLNYQDTVLRANEEVENGLVAFLREQDRLKFLEKSTGAAARSVEIAMRQYEKGVIFYQPLLDSERALVQQQDALAESRGLIGINLIAVYKALGGGWRARLAGQQPPAGMEAPPNTDMPPP
jgi:NodT family efflux transporter outer membrane factor (OMF) lipoprotein